MKNCKIFFLEIYYTILYLKYTIYFKANTILEQDWFIEILSMKPFNTFETSITLFIRTSFSEQVERLLFELINVTNGALILCSVPLKQHR